jgi:hypothetical protein
MEFGTYYATAAGIALLGNDPSAVFPQCRFLADAYRGLEMDGDPMDHEDITEPLPIAIEKVIAFVERNTRHPIRVVGLNRVRLDESQQKRFAKPWSTLVRTETTKIAAGKFWLRSFLTALSFPALDCLRLL